MFCSWRGEWMRSRNFSQHCKSGHGLFLRQEGSAYSHRHPARSAVREESLGIPGFAGLPVFICGISLGGCIAYNAVLASKASGESLIKCAFACLPIIVFATTFYSM